MIFPIIELKDKKDAPQRYGIKPPMVEPISAAQVNCAFCDIILILTLFY